MQLILISSFIFIKLLSLTGPLPKLTMLITYSVFWPTWPSHHIYTTMTLSNISCILILLVWRSKILLSYLLSLIIVLLFKSHYCIMFNLICIYMYIYLIFVCLMFMGWRFIPHLSFTCLKFNVHTCFMCMFILFGIIHVHVFPLSLSGIVLRHTGVDSEHVAGGFWARTNDERVSNICVLKSVILVISVGNYRK